MSRVVRRLRAGAGNGRARWWIPPPLAEWFAGERSRPIFALIAPFHGVLEELWAAWSDGLPHAVQPADWPPPVGTPEREASLAQLHLALTRSKPRWYGCRDSRDFGRV